MEMAMSAMGMFGQERDSVSSEVLSSRIDSVIRWWPPGLFWALHVTLPPDTEIGPVLTPGELTPGDPTFLWAVFAHPPQHTWDRGRQPQQFGQVS